MAKLQIRNRNAGKLDKNGKPKKPNWQYRFEGASIDGKRKEIQKSGFKTKKECEEAGIQAMAEFNTGLYFEPSEISFADYLDLWFDQYVVMNLKPNSQITYLRNIENHVKPALGMYRLSALTPTTLQEFLNDKTRQGYRNTTMTNLKAILTGSLKYAVHPAQLLKSSPAAYITKPKITGERAEIVRDLITREEFKTIMNRFKPGTPYRYALLIGWYTGMRINEVYGLTWDDVDFEKGTISINKQTVKRNYGVSVREVLKVKNKKEEKSAWYYGTPKTFKSTRTIKIGKTLLDELAEYKRIQEVNQEMYQDYYTNIYLKPEVDEKGDPVYRFVEVERAIPVDLPEANLLFRKENGEYSSSDSFKHAANIIHHQLDMPHFSFRGFRYSHATYLFQQGATPKAVQARLGHEHIETTLQIYAQVTAIMEDSAMELFEDFAAEE